MQHISEDIKTGNFKKAYLLYGEEHYLKRQYKSKLLHALCPEGDTMNTHFFEGKDISVGQVIDLAETLPFLSQYRVIVLTDSNLFKTGGEKLAEYLPSCPESTIFLFLESQVDKRSKLYKAVSSEGYAAEFTTQKEDVLKKWVLSIIAREKKSITENAYRLFLTKAGTDMDNIQMELEKLLCYTMDQDAITEEAVEAVCTTKINNRIFDMLDAVSKKQTHQALALYYDLLALKEPPLRILFMIARQCNTLLQVKELMAKGCDSKAIASTLGLHPFVAQKNCAQAAKFKASTLRLAVVKCVEAEEAVKSGRMNDQMSVEILILSVFGAQSA